MAISRAYPAKSLGVSVEGQFPQGRVVDDALQRLQAQGALAQLLVAVLVAAQGVHGVVKVDGLQPPQPNDLSNSSSTPSRSPAMS